MKLWVMSILVSIDKFVNVLFAPFLNWAMKPIYKFGNHRDTLSEVFGRNRTNCRFCYAVCRMLHWIDKNHCTKSIED